MYALVAAILMFLSILGVIPYQLALKWWLLLVALQFAFGWWPFPIGPPTWRRHPRDGTPAP
jgi:hypothetical protein